MIIYTAITDGYDCTRSDIKVIEVLGATPRLAAKEIKIFGDRLGEKATIWCDGNIFIKDTKPFEELLKSYDIVALKHPARNCIYEEAEVCKEMKLDYSETINKQIKYYKELKYPENNGLYACGVLARNHTEKMNELCNTWWEHITKYSWRDQISFPFVFKGISIGVVEPKTGDFYKNEIYEINPHLKTVRYNDI